MSHIGRVCNITRSLLWKRHSYCSFHHFRFQDKSIKTFRINKSALLHSNESTEYGKVSWDQPCYFFIRRDAFRSHDSSLEVALVEQILFSKSYTHLDASVVEFRDQIKTGMFSCNCRTSRELPNTWHNYDSTNQNQQLAMLCLLTANLVSGTHSTLSTSLGKMILMAGPNKRTHQGIIPKNFSKTIGLNSWRVWKTQC